MSLVAAPPLLPEQPDRVLPEESSEAGAARSDTNLPQSAWDEGRRALTAERPPKEGTNRPDVRWREGIRCSSSTNTSNCRLAEDERPE